MQTQPAQNKPTDQVTAVAEAGREVSDFPDEDSLIPFFKPLGVAVIGVSHNPLKLGYGLARNLIQSNYQGAIHFINPRGGTLFGRPIYRNIGEAPDPLNLAILLIPAHSVPQALRECGARGIKAVGIGSGGFRETGTEGALLEKECLRIAQTYAMRLLGPNSIGLIDTHLPIDATFLPPPGPLAGDVAFISHSGAICAAVIDWARGQGFGLSQLVSLGNQVDISETDVLASIAANPFTRVITMYLEGVSDGRRFVRQASQVTGQKPIIAIKVGRFTGGQRAVASHTGALAGQESAYSAAFRRAGVIRAETSEEMFDWARALAWCPHSTGRSVAVLTNAGGPGATATDALESNGMRLAKLSHATQQQLQRILPPAASLNNPIDMLASASPEQYAASLEIILADANVHSVLVILPPPPMYTAGEVARALIPVIHAADKPVVMALMGERLIQEAVEHLRAARVVEYRFPERAASALAVLAERAEFLKHNVDQIVPMSEISSTNHGSAQAILQQCLSQEGQFLPYDVIQKLLDCYNIRMPKVQLAHSPQEAVEKARHIGLPVVLKIASPDIPHKSDINGVALDLADEDAILRAFDEIMINTHRLRPQADILGVHVQQMIKGGQDVIIGAVQDAQFGALLMFGSGGIEVEGLKDVAFALAPITTNEIDYLIDSTWAGKKLRGYRHLRPADEEATVQVIINLGHLVSDFPQLAEIEINPLRVLPRGEGIYAIDVRAKIKP